MEIPLFTKFLKIIMDFLLINKPAGWTSQDAVSYIKKGLVRKGAEKNIKVGHAGTLDPFATGLLIVGVGREATKRLDEFKALPKTYIATVRLGATSTTGDPTGEITNSLILQSFNHSIILSSTPNESIIKSVLEKFIGKQNQIPPMYSAKKINGKKLYELARQGKEIERQPSAIEIYEIKLLEYNWPRLKIEIKCSAGTYIRTLAEDIGKKLGTGAYCFELTRTAIGEYKLSDAKTPPEAAG